MKRLKTYKVFESEMDEDDLVRKGHNRSWNDIKDVMTYLTDIGFEFEERSKKQYFIDEDGTKNWRNYKKVSLSDADRLVTELNFYKKLPDDYDIISEKGIYFQKWNDSQLEIFEAIASFSAHFDECYYSTMTKFDKFEIRFIIHESVDSKIIEKEKEEQINFKIRDKVIYNLERTKDYILGQLSPVTKNKIKNNKLGETMNFLQGSIEEGFIVVPINLISIQTQQAKKSCMSKLEMGIDRFESAIDRTGQVELREITEDDIDRLTELQETDKKYFSERYLGLMGYIIKFDYKKLFDKYKKSYYE
jgi:hypothetical protein